MQDQPNTAAKPCLELLRTAVISSVAMALAAFILVVSASMCLDRVLRRATQSELVQPRSGTHPSLESVRHETDRADAIRFVVVGSRSVSTVL